MFEELSDPRGGPLGLEVVRTLHQLVLQVYRLTEKYPAEERFGLVAQLRRAAASIPANIIEGRNRHSTKEFVHQLYIARGSLAETHYHLLLSRDLGYVNETDYAGISAEYERAGQLLGGLIRSLQRPGRHPEPRDPEPRTP
ncbi:MAG TPA: four helix bundle protein [Methylomirabilota bacterium]|nr:four helix bundle protein [Methylomirabilota bacterium]